MEFLKNLTKQQKMAVAGCVAAAAMMLYQTSAPVGPSTPSGTTPAADLQAIVAPIKALAATKTDAALALAPFYRAGADLIRRDDSGAVGSTGSFRDGKVTADRLYLQRTPMVGSLPGIGAATDKALVDGMAVDDTSDVPLDAVKRARLADTLDAIAWALGG